MVATNSVAENALDEPSISSRSPTSGAVATDRSSLKNDDQEREKFFKELQNPAGINFLWYMFGIMTSSLVSIIGWFLPATIPISIVLKGTALGAFGILCIIGHAKRTEKADYCAAEPETCSD